MSPEQNRLEIRVENQYFEATEITVPIAKVLIDGKDVFAGLGPNGFVGFDPDDLLSPDQPLLPVDSARRVAVYRCSCGEPGCGVVAPVISGTDAEVRWRDFQDFTGWFDRPLPEDEPQGGRPLDIPELTFEAAQYFNELLRATSDRSWETPTRQSARVLQELLAENAATWIRMGLKLDWVFPAHRVEDGVSLAFIDVDHRYVQRPFGHLVMTLTASSGSPETRASEMLQHLLSKSPEEWMAAFPWEAMEPDSEDE